jgi:hypothetical protein
VEKLVSEKQAGEKLAAETYDRTVAQSMVTGYPNATNKGHHTYESCVGEWQAHCQLGVHPHPVEPPHTEKGKQRASEGTSRQPRRSSSTPASHRTSGAVSVGRSRPASVRHYAIWGAGVVYSTK